ncbi:MAG: hypothetical protein NUW00_03845 [Candidatus Kaiserbacteria bacterium]|nr:hypothetical protein [Candidatus Kaiserbacteria bacterium]
MKHSITLQKNALLLLTLLSLVLASFAYAQEDAVAPEQGVRAGEARQELREERRTAVQSVSHERIFNLSRNVNDRLTSALLRMEKIGKRLETRITKLQSLGIDTAPAEAKLSEAMTLISTTQGTLASIASQQTALTGDDTREAFKAIRAEFITARDTIKQIHGLLREVVSLLKEAVRNGELGTGVSDAVRENTESETPVSE